MLTPSVIVAFSLIGLGLGLVLPGYEDLAFLSFITGLGGLILFISALLRSLQGGRARAFGGFDETDEDAAPIVVLDGSNIMHWRKGEPDLGPVREVIDDLSRRGFRTGVVFDANAGYKLEGRYRHHEVLARKLGLSQDLVMVVNKGEPADFTILRVAQDFGARVVTNDRFREWTDQFPKVAEPGFLISGGYRRGVLQLDI
ncbi:MAG: NYN domain-containing protein [Roseinatronobacter sp.]